MSTEVIFVHPVSNERSTLPGGVPLLTKWLAPDDAEIIQSREAGVFSMSKDRKSNEPVPVIRTLALAFITPTRLRQLSVELGESVGAPLVRMNVKPSSVYGSCRVVGLAPKSTVTSAA